MTLGIHTNTCTTRYILQRFFIHNKNISVLEWQQLLNPTLTILEEVAWALFIQKIGDSAQGGCKSQGDRPLQLKESPLMSIWSWTGLPLSLLANRGVDWADTSTHRLTHQSTELPGEPTRVEERERERAQFPIKDAENQLWICPDHLLQSRICQIQSIWCRSDWFQSNRLRIHWSRILDLLHYSSIYWLK